MSNTLQPPQLVVRQNFAARPAGTVRPLQPFIFGPLADLIRFDESDEKGRGYLGYYDADPSVVEGVAQTLYPWPSLPVGNAVDTDYTRLFVENGLFKYFSDVSQTAAINVARNKVRSPTKIFRTNGLSVSNVIDAGVAVGDRVVVSGVNQSAEPFTLASYVIDVEGDTVASTVAVPVPASSNRQNQAASANAVADPSNGGTLAIAASAANYNGLATGHLNEVYTVEVIVGGGAGTARVSVTSASGTDNVASLTTVPLGDPLQLTDRGASVIFTAGPGSTFVVGDKWTVTVAQAYTATSATVSGTYTGTRDRVYIVEITQGGELGSDNIGVYVSSQDGTDTLATQSIAAAAAALGSYGLTINLVAADGIAKGDKFTVVATAATEGDMKTLVLAHELPNDVATDDSADLEISLYKMYSREIPNKSHISGLFNFTPESTQIRVRGDLQISLPEVTLNSVMIPMELSTVPELPGTGKLYVTMRSWYPTSSDIFSITSLADLDAALPGPTHPDNPLKYAISLARAGAVGETVHGFNVGNPDVGQNWSDALTAADRSDVTYGYVPLTHDKDILLETFSAVSAANSETQNSYRVMWSSSAHMVGGAIVDATKTSDEEIALAVVEDNSAATGTQYTQLRITSGNADLNELGVRVGDTIRYLYTVDAWGDEQYVTRTISEVRSATTVVLSEPFSAAEIIPKRVEFHRTYQSGELRDAYSAEASQWGSDLVRHVIAPVVHVGSHQLPAYFITPVLAGMRAYFASQQPLSTMQIPGILRISGLEILGVDDLNRMAGSGCFICMYNYRDSSVRIRHAITTGDTDILARREESMVSARHTALFQINARLAIYAGRGNLGEDDQFDIFSEQIFSELQSVKKALQTQDFTPELGGVIRDLIITDIRPSETQADELIVEGELVLGRPSNRITFNVLVR